MAAFVMLSCACGWLQDASGGSPREHSARSGTEYFSQASSEAPNGVSPAAGVSGDSLPVEPDSAKEANGAQEQADSPDDKWYKDPVVSRLHCDMTAPFKTNS